MSNVLLIGEDCIDRYIHCDVLRLCPEAPCGVANPTRTTETRGMAGNVFNNLVSLAAPASGFHVDWMSQHGGQPILKTRYVDNASRYIMLRVDEFEPVDEGLEVDETLDQIYLLKPDIIVISDYNKGFLSEDLIRAIGNTAYHLRIPVFMDTKRHLGEWSLDITYVKINQREYEAHLFEAELWCQNLIVTRGARGTWVPSTDELFSVDPIEVSDVTGAGDVYLAALVVNYLETKDLHSAITWANRAARLSVSKHGTVSIKREELV